MKTNICWSFSFQGLTMITVYLLYSSKLNQFYKGQTNNLSNRLIRHNSGYEKFTKGGNPWKLIWTTGKESRCEAKQLEKKLSGNPVIPTKPTQSISNK